MAESRPLKLHRGTVTITPGVLDREAEYAFSGGHCHSLACAIARRMNKNIVVLGRNHNHSKHGVQEFEPRHVMVELSAKRWGDVRGAHTVAPSLITDLNTYYGAKGEARIMTPDDFEKIVKPYKKEWLPEDPMLAGPFIQPVVERWGLGHKLAAADVSDQTIER